VNRIDKERIVKMLKDELVLDRKMEQVFKEQQMGESPEDVQSGIDRVEKRRWWERIWRRKVEND